MVLPASRETKAGLGRGKGTPRHPGPRAMGSNVVDQNTDPRSALIKTLAPALVRCMTLYTFLILSNTVSSSIK